MPVLITDWDSRKRRPIVIYGVACTRCGVGKKSDEPTVPPGWEEAENPNADGRIVTLCPDCQD